MKGYVQIEINPDVIGAMREYVNTANEYIDNFDNLLAKHTTIATSKFLFFPCTDKKIDCQAILESAPPGVVPVRMYSTPNPQPIKTGRHERVEDILVLARVSKDNTFYLDEDLARIYHSFLREVNK